MESALARYVRESRHARGLSLRALSAQAGVSKSALHAWETGLQRPSVPELDAVLRVYEVGAEERAKVLLLVGTPHSRRELHRATHHSLGPAPSASGDLLRALRIRRGLGVAGAARLIGVQSSTVLRWERGEIWPAPDRIEAIATSLGARSAERTALLGASRNVLAPRPRNDRTAIERAIFDFRHWSWIGEPMPLVELQLVSAVADLWPMIGHWAGAGELYRQANAFLGCWALVAHGALDDATIYARRAVMGDDGTVPRTTLAWPAHILAKNAAYGSRRHRPAAGASFLAQYGGRYRNDDGLLAWYQRDLAEFTADAGDLDAALALSSQARETTRRAGDPTMNADFDHARLLVRAGRYDEAVGLLPPSRPLVPLQEATEAVTWTEALLGLSEIEEAASRFETARGLAATHGLATLAPRIEALAARMDR